MGNEYRQLDHTYDSADTQVASERNFINKVYGWMTVGLAITAGGAWWMSTKLATMSPEQLTTFSRSMWMLLIAEIALVMIISWGIKRINSATAAILFLVYSALTGISLSPIMIAYSGQTLTQAFAASGATFGACSIWGYVTKRDLSGIGGLAFMGLIGFLIGTVINLFWANSTLYWIVTYLGIAVFIGLTAYDTQKIRQMAQAAGDGTLAGENASKGALLGALALYLDFINLFLLMLRLFGGNRR